jgi:hypothetical protein
MAVYEWFFIVLCVLASVFCVLNAAVYWQQRAAPFAFYLVGVDIADGMCSFTALLLILAEVMTAPDAFAPLWIKR